MRADLEGTLFRDFPHLYSDRNPATSAMSFGFSCGNGWYALVRELSERLDALRPRPVAAQVKQKFGLLRVYLAGGKGARAFEVIQEFEARSAKTCEICGAPGEVRRFGGWLQATCERCAKKLGTERHVTPEKASDSASPERAAPRRIVMPSGSGRSRARSTARKNATRKKTAKRASRRRK